MVWRTIFWKPIDEVELNQILKKIADTETNREKERAAKRGYDGEKNFTTAVISFTESF